MNLVLKHSPIPAEVFKYYEHNSIEDLDVIKCPFITFKQRVKNWGNSSENEFEINRTLWNDIEALKKYLIAEFNEENDLSRYVRENIKEIANQICNGNVLEKVSSNQELKTREDQSVLVSSFSRTAQSLKLWREKSKEQTGFCIGYSTELLKNQFELFPIYYRNSKFYNSIGFPLELRTHINFINMVLRLDEKFSDEYEVRGILTNYLNDNKKVELRSNAISSLVIGEYMKEEKRELLLEQLRRNTTLEKYSIAMSNNELQHQSITLRQFKL